MRLIHPNQLSDAERQRLTREAAVSVARLRIKNAAHNTPEVVADAHAVLRKYGVTA
jgi:hypothetical protein